MSKVIKATYKKGVSEPLEPVDFPEGAELLVTVEEAAVANQWFADLHRLFAPVRKEFTRESEAYDRTAGRPRGKDHPGEEAGKT